MHAIRYMLVCTSCSAGWPTDVDHGSCNRCGGDLELRGVVHVYDLPKPGVGSVTSVTELIRAKLAEIRATYASMTPEERARAGADMREAALSWPNGQRLLDMIEAGPDGYVPPEEDAR